MKRKFVVLKITFKFFLLLSKKKEKKVFFADSEFFSFLTSFVWGCDWCCRNGNRIFWIYLQRRIVQEKKKNTWKLIEVEIIKEFFLCELFSLSVARCWFLSPFSRDAAFCWVRRDLMAVLNTRLASRARRNVPAGDRRRRCGFWRFRGCFRKVFLRN